MKKAIFILFVLPVLGLSQDTNARFITDLKTVPGEIIKEFTITSNRIENTYAKEGKSVLIIDAEQIKNTPGVSINDILVQHAGIDIRQRGANGVQADVGIRGSTFDQVLVLLNGVRMSDPQTGHHSMNIPVDVSAIERIEVIKGAGARVYGQNSLAGVINIITKNPEETFVRAKAIGGDFNLSDFTVSAGLNQKNSKHFLSINNSASTGYKFNTDYNITNAFYSVKFGGYRKKYPRPSHKRPRFELMAGFTERKFGANGFYASPDFIDQYEEIQTSVVSLKYNGYLTRNTKFTLGTYWRRNQDEYVFLRFQPEVFRNMHIGNTGGINFNAVSYNKIGQTGFGADISRVWIQSNNLGNRTRNIQTAFLEHKFSLAKDRLHITPGVQASYYSDFGSVFLPGVDANYTLNNSVSFFGNIGQTYRVPTYTDLFYQGRTNIGNPDLKPEIALSYEAGVRVLEKGFKFQASYFVREGSNTIDWTRTSAMDPWQPNNLIKLNTNGLDVDFSMNETWIPSGNAYFGFNFGYTYLDQETTVDNGLLSAYALENLNYQLTSALSFTTPNLAFSVNYRYSDRVNLDDYSIVDTRLAYNFTVNGKGRQITTFGEVSNVFNQEYRETNLVIMPGRWFRIGISYHPKENKKFDREIKSVRRF